MLHRGLIVAILSTLLLSNISRADEKGTACVPPCSEGQRCLNQVCVSPSPRCNDDEIRTRNGHCIPKEPPAVVETAALSLQPPDSRGTGSKAADMQLYLKFQRKKRVGVVLMTVGIICVLSAGGLGGAGGATGEEAFMYAGIGVEVLGNLIFFPGLAMMIKGKVGMNRTKKRMDTAQMRWGISPLFFSGYPTHRNPVNSGGLKLSIAW